MRPRHETPQSDEYFPVYDVSLAAQEAAVVRPPLVGQVFVGFFVLFFIGVVVFSAVTKIPVVVEAPGKLESLQSLVPVKAQASFVVSRLLVKEGDQVKKDQLLADSSENLAEQDIARLKNYVQGLRAIANLPDRDPCTGCLKSLQRLSADYLQIRAQGEIQSLIQPINDVTREVIGAVQNYQNIEPSIADVRMNIDLAKQKLGEIKKRNAEALLARDVENYRTQILAGQTRISERYQSALLQIQQNRSLLKARLVELEARLSRFGKTYNVLAPFDGIVMGIKIKGAGELVSPGQILLEIMPKGSLLRATIVVQNKDIGQVQAGNEAILTIDALPEIDYGTVTGSVSEVLRSEGGDPSMAASQAGTFDVRIALEKQSLTKGATETPFILGMTCRAKVVVRHESILKSLFRKLFKIKDDLAVKAT